MYPFNTDRTFTLTPEFTVSSYAVLLFVVFGLFRRISPLIDLPIRNVCTLAVHPPRTVSSKTHGNPNHSHLKPTSCD